MLRGRIRAASGWFARAAPAGFEAGRAGASASNSEPVSSNWRDMAPKVWSVPRRNKFEGNAVFRLATSGRLLRAQAPVAAHALARPAPARPAAMDLAAHDGRARRRATLALARRWSVADRNPGYSGNSGRRGGRLPEPRMVLATQHRVRCGRVRFSLPAPPLSVFAGGLPASTSRGDPRTEGDAGFPVRPFVSQSERLGNHHRCHRGRTAAWPTHLLLD